MFPKCTCVSKSYSSEIFICLFVQGCDMLACHNYWHWALYYIEKVINIMSLLSQANRLHSNALEGLLLIGPVSH